MPWARVLAFSDPLACQAAVQAADVEILPIAKGDFQAEITQVGMNTIWMQRFVLALPQITTIACNPDRRSLCFLTEPDAPPLQYCGLEVLPGDMVNNRFDVAHQRSSPNYHYGAISMPVDELDAALEAITGGGVKKRWGESVLRPPPAMMSRLLNLHEMVGRLAHDTPDILGLPEVIRALENAIVHIMIRCLSGGYAVDARPGSRRHDMIMARFEEYLEAHSSRPLYLPEICAAIGVAERTLRASCEERLGMGPIRYLTLRRMHLTRRALLRADASRATVTRIVTDHGFWELGRFSVAYRALFGESPSHTLRRPAQQIPAWLNRPSSLTAPEPSAQANGLAILRPLARSPSENA